jgi:methionine--tRNA ligase beta chain
MITFDDLQKIELRVGQILSAEPVEGSQKLLKLSVDFGEETPRTVVSGIAAYVDIESFIGTQKVFVTNLEPRAIMGIESQAMILAGKDDVTMGLTTMDRPIKNGTILS